MTDANLNIFYGYASVVTVGLVVYYAYNIWKDHHAERQADHGNDETFDVSGIPSEASIEVHESDYGIPPDKTAEESQEAEQQQAEQPQADKPNAEPPAPEQPPKEREKEAPPQDPPSATDRKIERVQEQSYEADVQSDYGFDSEYMRDILMHDTIGIKKIGIMQERPTY
jgi:outer membrane biosynthesis protein TonB